MHKKTVAHQITSGKTRLPSVQIKRNRNQERTRTRRNKNSAKSRTTVVSPTCRVSSFSWAWWRCWWPPQQWEQMRQKWMTAQVPPILADETMKHLFIHPRGNRGRRCESRGAARGLREGVHESKGARRRRSCVAESHVYRLHTDGI